MHEKNKIKKGFESLQPLGNKVILLKFKKISFEQKIKTKHPKLTAGYE